MNCSWLTRLGDVRRWRWLFLKSPAPAPAGALVPAKRAPRPPHAGQQVRAVGPLSATDKVVWRCYLGPEQRPASSSFRWPAAGFRYGRPPHTAAVWRRRLFPWNWEISTQFSPDSPDHLRPLHFTYTLMAEPVHWTLFSAL